MTVTTPDLTATQRAAIADSGWGYAPKLVKPRNFSFWVIAFLLFLGGSALYLDTLVAIGAYQTEIVQGVAYFAVFGALILWIILRMDRFSKIPARVKVLVIFIGGLVSTFAMSLPYNDAFLVIWSKTQTSAFVLDWGAGATAPHSEEISKMIPLILMIGLVPRVVRCAFDGLIIGMLSGAAFQIFEDVKYVWEGVDSSFGDSAAGVQTMFTRTGFGFTGHWMWSGVVGAGLIYLIGRPAEKRNVGLGAALIAAPMVIHGVTVRQPANSGVVHAFQVNNIDCSRPVYVPGLSG